MTQDSNAHAASHERGAPPEVVLYSFFPWLHTYPSTAHGLARALRQHTRVWFVNKPPTVKDALFQRRDIRTFGAGRAEEAVVQGEVRGEGEHDLMIVDLPPTLSINGLPPGKIYNTLARRNDRAMGQHLGRVLQAHGVEDFIWINLYAPTQYVNLYLHRPPATRIYYSVDALDQVPYTARHGVRAEHLQMERADITLATSANLGQRLEPYAETLHVLPNGVDAETWIDRTFEEDAELSHIPHPQAGYVGNLDSARVDFDLLMRLAESRPDLHLVLIGPWNAGDELRKRFEAQSNIHLLGRRAPEDCPRLLSHVDFGIIPFQINGLTASIYPLKINEYLGLGLPVLATPFSLDIRSFSNVIRVENAEDWVAAVDEVLRDERRSKRMALARQNTWTARAEQLLSLVAELRHARTAPQATVQSSPSR